MEDKNDDFSFDSWKENWQEISQKSRVISEELSKTLSEASEKISKASAKAASQARETIEERRKNKEMKELIKEIDQIVAVSSQTPADEKEVARLRLRVATLEVNQKEQEKLIEKMNDLVHDIPQNSSSEENNIGTIIKKRQGFFSTIKQTHTLIGFAAIWTLIVVFIGEYAESIDSEVFGYQTSIFVWVIGAMIWAYSVLTQVSTAGSFNDLPLQFRLQATLGVGASTVAIHVLSGISNMSPMFYIYVWLVMVALTVLFLSAIINGFNSLKNNT